MNVSAISSVLLDKRNIILESQLPQGMSGEKLKALEQGPVPEAVEEEKPQVPPKFLYEVNFVDFFIFIFFFELNE